MIGPSGVGQAPKAPEAQSAEWELIDDARRLTTAEVCAWFGVPVHLVTEPAPRDQVQQQQQK